MKKILAVICVLSSLKIGAQQISLEANTGLFTTHDFNYNRSTFSRISPHFELGGTYMMTKKNDVFGIRLDVAYERINYRTSSTLAYPNSNLLRADIHAIFKLYRLYHVTKDRFGIRLNFGLGLTTLTSNDLKKIFELENRKSPFFKNNDDMINLTMGINPQFKINDKLFLNATLSYHHLFLSNLTFDTGEMKSDDDFDFTMGMANYFNVSVGINYVLMDKK